MSLVYDSLARWSVAWGSLPWRSNLSCMLNNETYNSCLSTLAMLSAPVSHLPLVGQCCISAGLTSEETRKE